jgi:hypothetical protein
MRMTTEEQERAAYMAGDTDAAALLARIDDLQRALGQSVAALEAVAYDQLTAKQAAGAAVEGLHQVQGATK